MKLRQLAPLALAVAILASVIVAVSIICPTGACAPVPVKRVL